MRRANDRVGPITLARYNLRDRGPAWQATDERLVQHYRNLLLLLRRG